MDKVWVIPGPDRLLHDMKTKLDQPEPFIQAEKNPAKAYSWSVLFWGGGQFYNNRILKGLSLFFLTAAFYTGIVITVVFWTGIVRFLHDRGMSVSILLLVMFALLFCYLTSRCLCCSCAYYRVARSRKNCFTGTGSRKFPFLCSILLPGWGQFLNGQPLKGSLFAGLSVVSIFSLISVPVVLLTWKDLDPSSARLLIEAIFTVGILFLPLLPFIWIVSSHDALKVSREEWKKKPLWPRARMAGNLWRSRVWVNRLFHRIKRMSLLTLFLAFLLIILNSNSSRQFYSGQLESARSRLQMMNMTLLPDLLGRIPHGTVPGKN